MSAGPSVARTPGRGRPSVHALRRSSELDQSIPERFEKQVLIHPDRLAIRSPDGSFTYAELNRTANRLARAILATSGAKAGAVATLRARRQRARGDALRC